MNNSRSTRKGTLKGCASNTSDLTITKSEVKKDTVNYSLDYDVCNSKDISDCQIQSKRLHESENDSEVFTPPSKRIKIAQGWTFSKTEILKQPYENEKYDIQEDDGTEDSQGDNGTDDSQEDDGTDDSQEDDGIDDSQEDDGSDDGHKESCNKKDEADLFYGTHETQVSEGGEADLHKHFNSCEKNPGHTKFVPVNDFNISHLPEGHHDNDLVELIKAVADVTVKVDVKMTSTERSEFWPNTTVPYAFYNMRGTDVMRVGTGTVYNVNTLTEEYIKKYNKGTCQCHKCQHSDTPSKVWGEVSMVTATHVVFDKLEARHTTCRLFYDGQDSPLVTLDGWTVCWADIEEDWCKLECVTCDVDLLDILYKMVTHWEDLWEKVTNKYESSRDEVKLTFIVSHPHGCPKQVSVGQWIDRYVLDDDYSSSNTKYTYTTCTCPGSSGAHVHPLGYDHGSLFNARHVHTGVNSKENNFCGAGRELR